MSGNQWRFVEYVIGSSRCARQDTLITRQQPLEMKYRRQYLSIVGYFSACAFLSWFELYSRSRISTIISTIHISYAIRVRNIIYRIIV